MSDYYVPSKLQNIPIRPLTGGVRLDQPPQLLPAGTFLKLDNLIVTQRGLKRRDGLGRAIQFSNVNDYPIREFGYFWDKGGLTYTSLIGQKWLYQWTASGAVPVYFVYNTGSYVSRLGTTYTFSGSSFLNKWIQPGDILHLEDASNSEDLTILSSPTTDDNLVVEAEPSVVTTPTSWELRKVIGLGQEKVFSVITGSQMIITDGNRPPYLYNGSSVSQLTDVATETDDYIPLLSAYWKGRIWTGYIKEYEASSWNLYRYRMRWSNAGDFTTYDAADYIDFVQTQGRMQRIVPFNNMLLVFMSDAMYYCLPSNVVDYPVIPNKIDTGGVGLVGPRAVATFKDSCFWVGQDNIFMFSPEQGNVEIGTPILEESLKVCENLEDVQVVVAPEISCVLFAFPTSSSGFSALWAYNYFVKAWSKLNISGDLIFVESIVRQYTYDSWTEGVLDGQTGSGTATGNEITLDGSPDLSDYGDGDTIAIFNSSYGFYDFYTVASIAGSVITIDETLSDDYSSAACYLVLASETYDTGLTEFETYDDISASENLPKQLYISVGDSVYRMQVGLIEDYSGNYFTTAITPDIDLDIPDTNKFFNRLTLRLNNVNSSGTRFQFSVEASVNRGSVWENLGMLSVEDGDDEGKIDFALSAPSVRFRIIGSGNTENYVISEFILRARPVGLQIQGV